MNQQSHSAINALLLAVLLLPVGHLSAQTLHKAPIAPAMTAAEANPCALYRYTKGLLEKKEADLNLTINGLKNDEEKLSSAIDKGIWRVSISATTVAIVVYGQRAFSKRVVSEIERGKLTWKVFGFGGLFSIAAGATVASILVSGHEIFSLHDRVAQLRLEKMAAKSKVEELQETLKAETINKGCGAD